MGKAKRIILVGLMTAVVIAIFSFLWFVFTGPYSLDEVFDENFSKITTGKGTSEFDYFNIQEYDGDKYYEDCGKLVRRKADGNEKEIKIKNCRSFLLRDDKLIYTLLDVEDKVYIEDLKNKSRNTLLVKKARILSSEQEYVYIYSGENVLYKFDRKWNEIEKISFKEKGFKGRFEKVCIVKGKLLFATEELDLYIYDEKKDALNEIEMPKVKGYSEDRDIIRWEDEVYCMLSYYDDADLHVAFSKADLPQSGIYKVDVNSEKAEKVSDETGGIMLLLDNQLFIAESYLFLGGRYILRQVTL